MSISKKKIIKIIALVLAVIIGLIAILFGLLTITEYKPKDTESLEVSGEASKTLSRGDTINLVTWNVGYCGLGEEADFFLDGGENVRSSNKATVKDNLSSIAETTAALNPDVVFLQEVDVNSRRSYHINQYDAFTEALDGYSNTFATNYKSLFIPYPFPPIGKVNAGIATYSKYEISESTRVQLPCPFAYPERLGNLKRCLVVNRVPIEDSDKELVLINLHLEAYASDEEKATQTAVLKEYLDQEVEKGNYVIAGGDFNQIFSNIDSRAYPQISEDLWKPGYIDINEFSDEYKFVMDDQVPSCRSLDRPLIGNDTAANKFQYYIIDGFIVSDNIMVQNVSTQNLQFKNSDHNPLVMTVRLR